MLRTLPLRPSLVDRIVAELREVDRAFDALEDMPHESRTAARRALEDRACLPRLRFRRAFAALQAERGCRARGQARAARSEPAAGRVDREALHEPRPVAARSDPGRQHRPDEGGRSLPVPPRLQVLDLRDVVGPAGGHARDRRLRPDHPPARARLRLARPADARAPRARPRSSDARRRRRSSLRGWICRSGRSSCCSRPRGSRRRSKRRSATPRKRGSPIWSAT